MGRSNAGSQRQPRRPLWSRCKAGEIQVSGESITAQNLRQVLISVAQKIIEQESYLNSLDAAVGDGDHGITMRLGFQAIIRKLGELDPQIPMDIMLREVGTAFMGATGGAIGVILGRALIAAGNALQGSSEMGATEFRHVLGAMEVAIATAGKAKPGDKTILDAVHGANRIGRVALPNLD